jgi:hypothetical protein
LIAPDGITDAGYTINMQKVEPIVLNRLAAGPVNVLRTTRSTFDGPLETAAP